MAKPELLKSGSEAATRHPVGQLLRQSRRGFWVVALLSGVIELVSVSPIIYMWNAYDRVIPSRSMVTLISLTILIIGVYIFWSALDWIRSRLMIRLSLRIDWDLAADIFDAAFRRHVGRRKVNAQQAMADLVELRQFLGGAPILAVITAPFALVFVGVGALFHPYMAVFSLFSAAVMLVAGMITRGWSTKSLQVASDARTEASRLSAAVMRQAESTLALGMMPQLRQRWYQRHREFLQYQVESSDTAGSGQALTSFLRHSFPSLGLALGMYLAIEGLITSGMVIVASMIVSRAITPLQQLINNWPRVVKAQQAYRRLNILLQEDTVRQQSMPLPAPSGRVLVENVSMLPSGARKPVLLDVGFELSPGEVLAVVGPSASGKSSLARLLVGVWKPTGGSIRLDGAEISDWDHDELGPHIGYVPQDVEFFEGTVAENIARLGAVDSAKVVEAAKLIGMHDIILSWPNGYDTMLGDSGFALSGGQRQRLAIARALYGNPVYVVFDEPNANLDESGEKALVDALHQLRERKTTVIVTTHRPRLIGVVDYMLVLKGGKQVGYGAPKDLFDAVKRSLPTAIDAGNSEEAAA